jgi:hypothetical protein
MGFFQQFGSFASSLWDSFKQAFSPIAEALGFGQETGYEISAYDAVKELTHVRRQDDYAPLVSAVQPQDYIPREYYGTAEIPWNRPYAYEVEFYGRDLETGRYVHTGRWVTSSRELTAGEAEELALAYFAAEGQSAQIDVMQAGVVAAQLRPGEVR